MNPLVITRIAVAGVVATQMATGHDAFAQQISAALVREATTAKLSESKTVTLMSLSPLKIWREGDPIRVKGDLKGHDDPGVLKVRPESRPDPLLRRSGSVATQGLLAAPILTAAIGVNIAGIPATGFLPPDTVGAVGPKHYIQMVNSAFAIYDKTGKLLAGPSEINSLWRGFGGPCETDNDGDPVVRYDHLADRWFVSQFAVKKNMQCIAISRGGDPVQDGWFLYAFSTRDASGKDVTPDYPKIGVWSDGYYMSTQRGFPSQGLDVWVFEREKMLAGKPARQVQFTVGKLAVVLLPSNLTGLPPPAGTPNYFVREVDGERFGGNDRIEIFAFTVDWQNPSASSFKLVSTLSPAPFDSFLCKTDLMSPCVPQAGTKVRLETLGAWPMFAAQYRNFQTHQALVFNHSVNIGRDRAGIRWYELRLSPDGGGWKIEQQGTHAPDDTHRWMGSAAIDGSGNIALGYSVSSDKIFPGIRVAVRKASDPPGQLGPETVVVDGGGAQTYANVPRWGDYSAMEVDPIRTCSFWYTTLYYDKSSDAGWNTRIAELRMPGC